MHNLIVRVCIVLLFTFLVVSITVEGNDLNTITGNAPAPAPVVCADNDQAKGDVNAQSLVKSFVLSADVQHDDDCVKERFGGDKTSEILNEQTCATVKGRLKLVSVAVDCAGLNKVCENGACVAAPPEGAQVCNRDDDCIVELGGSTCFSHICQTRACSETDGGNDPSVAGVLTLDYSISNDVVNKDICLNNARVIEYSCLQNGESSMGAVVCPQGTTCQMNADNVGACVAVVQGGGGGQHQETDDNTAGTSNYFRRMERFNTLMRR